MKRTDCQELADHALGETGVGYMKRDEIVAVVALMVLGVVAPMVVVGAAYSSVLSFDPARFVNDLFGFIISVAGILVGFALGQVYWRSRTAEEDIRNGKAQFGHYAAHIAGMVFETGGALKRHVLAGDDEEVRRRDQDVIANLRRLGDASKLSLEFLDHVRSSFLKKEKASEAVRLFRTDVAPELLKLSQRSEICPDLDGISKGLQKAGTKLDEIRRLLEEV